MITQTSKPSKLQTFSNLRALQAKPEGAAFTIFAFHTDGATVLFNNHFANRQA
jgi:hypothetical protein